VYPVCMARRNISLPDDLDELARRRGLNVSALARGAIVAELERSDRMAQLDAWLDELDATHGAPSAEAIAAAETWASTATVARPRPARATTSAR